MIFVPLTAEETRNNNYTHRCVIDFKDLQAISGSGAKAVTCFTAPVGTAVLGVCFILQSVFAGGSLSAMTASVGDGTATQYGSANDVFTGSTVTTVLSAASTHKVYTSATAVKVTFTPTSDTVSAATSGKLTVLFRLADTAKLAA